MTATLRALPVKALIFDMDGTIVESMPYHTSTWLEFVKKHGLSINVDDMMRRTTGRTGVECVRLLMDQPDMDEALAWALGLNVGLGTAGDIHNVGFALRHLKLDPPPDAIARRDEGLTGKPTPSIFLAAAQRMDVAPSECIVFEDAPLGIEAARRAGMRAVAVCTGHSPQELAGSHVVAAVPDFTELMNMRFLEKTITLKGY